MRVQITVEQNYLRIPVKVSGPEQRLSVRLGEELVYQFAAALPKEAGEGCDFYAELPVWQWKGREITVETEGEPVLALSQDDALLPREEGRYPYLHFTPKSGWLNDPNGLCRYREEYHLFFQHNPFHTKWNNMSWGHAVSRDLLHWEQGEEALFPDGEGSAYSGCAVAEGEKLCLYYTCAGGDAPWSEGKPFTQRLAVSRDGKHFEKEKEPVLPWIVNENRDPKLFWHEESRAWIMALYLDGHEYALFRSPDRESWEMTQCLTVEESSECPDLFPLPTGEDGQEKWVFWTADGYYLVGDFDGWSFRRTQEARRLYGTPVGERMAYAAQTFWGIPGRTVQMAWMQHIQRAGLYCGGLSLPRELSLVRRGEEWKLSARLVRELYQQETRLWEGVSADGQEISFSWEEEGAALLQLKAEGSGTFSVDFCGALITCSPQRQELQINSLQVSLGEPALTLTLLADRGMLEIGACQDTVCCFVQLEMEFPREMILRGAASGTLGIVR